MNRIYLDYASLTPIDPLVLSEMKKYSSKEYANPGSLYKEGVAAKKALEHARKSVADFLHAHPDEIVFTSGGTEGNNIVMKGAISSLVSSALGTSVLKKPHIIISNIEHSSIMETTSQLEKEGVEVTRLKVDKNGLISLDELKKSIKTNTVLVSIIWVNNEIGTIQPMKEIAKIVREARKSKVSPLQSGSKVTHCSGSYPLFHTDAAQALYQDINMEKLGVDLLTLDGGKIYGPRGVGALYIRRNTPIQPINYGGGQEKGLRSGTENLPAIMGFAKAVELLKDDSRFTIYELKKRFIEGLNKIRADITLNGDLENSTPHIVNISIPGIDNEFFLFQFDAKGIAISTKSSCLRDEDESYVLKAIGARSNNSLRFSFGRWTKKEDISKTLKVIKEILFSSQKI